MANELKDMKMLSSNDEAFYVSRSDIRDIIDLINAREMPAHETYLQWDEYAKSFFLKMCICFGVDYQHFKVASKDDGFAEIPSEEHDLLSKLETKECSPSLLPKVRLDNTCTMWKLKGPYRFGSYSPGTEPGCISYHLYLLVKKVADIMEQNNNTEDLTLLEKKIKFFYNYFYSHLPRGWIYDRNKARSLIAGYDPMHKPRYCMYGYNPKSVYKYTKNYDEKSFLTQFRMADIMNIIHSKERPSFRDMYPDSLSFYCKLCSCFGIDYHRLDKASEDDVCLMNVGGKPTLRYDRSK